MLFLIFHLMIPLEFIQTYKISSPELPMKKCLRVTINQGQIHTMFIDSNNDTDNLIKDCIIRKAHNDQSILLVHGLKSRSKNNQFPSNVPNVIVMTNSLNHELIESFSTHQELKYHWNMFYIVVTADDNTYICKDGKFDENTFNLIQNFMNDFWHKYEMIRVIILFPYSCPRTYAIYGKTLQTDKLLYNRTVKIIRPKTFKDLSKEIIKSSSGLSHGYPLRATIFERFPTSVTNCDRVNFYMNYNSTISNGFCGVDGLIMYETIKHYKFNVTFSDDKECSGYGYLNCDKQAITGSLGCIIENKIDISFNSRFMVLYINERFDYLHYVTHDSLCALLPIPHVYPLWHFPHMPMNIYISIPIALIIFIITSVAWVSATIMNKVTNEVCTNFKDSFFDFATCILFGFSLRKYYKFYLLRGFCLGCSIIFLSYYQGYINYTFTTLRRYDKVKTLQELYKNNYVLYTSPSVRELLRPLENPNDKEQEHFLKRTKVQTNTDIGIVLEQNLVVTLGRKSDARSEILLRYRNKHGSPLIYVVDECFRDYYLSYVNRFGFPFTKDMKIFVERILQAGLPGIYNKWTRRTLHLPDTLPEYEAEPRPTARIRIQDLRIPMGLLLIGHAISALIFAVEKWLNRRNMFVVFSDTFKR